MKQIAYQSPFFDGRLQGIENQGITITRFFERQPVNL